MKTIKNLAGISVRGERGFTLIELLAVMAIVATLAAIVATSVSGTGETSTSTAAQQDATTVNSAAADFFADQTGSAVITGHTVNVMAALPVTGSGSVVVFDTPPASPSSDADPIQQIISSRWPEKFITTGLALGDGGVAGVAVTGSSAYEFEFPTTTVFSNGSSGDAVRVIIRGIADEDGTPGKHITRKELLKEYTAIDFDKLVDGIANSDFTGGYSEEAPDALDQKSGNFHNFLWMFRKTTAAGGSGDDDSRTITVFKLANVKVLENETPYGDAGDVELTYEQIF